MFFQIRHDDAWRVSVRWGPTPADLRMWGYQRRTMRHPAPVFCSHVGQIPETPAIPQMTTRCWSQFSLKLMLVCHYGGFFWLAGEWTQRWTKRTLFIQFSFSLSIFSFTPVNMAAPPHRSMNNVRSLSHFHHTCVCVSFMCQVHQWSNTRTTKSVTDLLRKQLGDVWVCFGVFEHFI